MERNISREYKDYEEQFSSRAPASNPPLPVDFQPQNPEKEDEIPISSKKLTPYQEKALESSLFIIKSCLPETLRSIFKLFEEETEKLATAQEILNQKKKNCVKRYIDKYNCYVKALEQLIICKEIPEDTTSDFMKFLMQDTADISTQKILSKFHEEGFQSKEMADEYVKIAESLFYKEQILEAEDTIKKVLNICNSLKYNGNTKGKALYIMGNINYYNKKNDKALNDYFDARDIFSRCNKYYLAQTFVKLGHVNCVKKLYNPSLTYYNNALFEFQQILEPFDIEISDTLLNVARAKINSNDIDGGLENLYDVLERYRSVDNKIKIRSVLKNIIRQERAKKELNIATHYAWEVIDTLIDCPAKFIPEKAKAYKRIANIEYDKQNWESALEAAQESFELCKISGYNKKVFVLIIKIYKKMNMKQKAKDYENYFTLYKRGELTTVRNHQN